MRHLTRGVGSLAAGLPLVWFTASSDGFSASPDTGILEATTAVSRSCTTHDITYWPLSLLSEQLWRLPVCMSGYLPNLVVVHAKAEEKLTGIPLETAYRVSLMQPLLSYMPEVATVPSPTPDTLKALEATAIEGFKQGSDVTQVVTLAWSLAWSGHQPSQQYVELLQAAASGSLTAVATQRPSAAHRAVLLWCTVMHSAVPQTVWESALHAVSATAAAAPRDLDDCALMYLLHASLLYGAESALPNRRTAAAATGSTAGTGSVSPTSPASASASSPSCQPRATREEVMAVAAPLGRKILEKLVTVYGEYVPLHPAIEGPYMALLYVLKQLAVAANGGSSGGGGGWGLLGYTTGAATPAESAWAPSGISQQAAAVLSNSRELARIRRDLLYHWRGDQSLDEVQRVRNQVVYLLSRRMGLTVTQPDDVDVAVPSRWLALYVRGGGSNRVNTAASPHSLGESDVLSALKAASDEGLEVLVRDRFAPQVHMPTAVPPGVRAAREGAAAAGGGGGGGAAVGCGMGPAGIWAAHVRQLRRLGWRVVVVDVESWRAIGSDVEREGYLLKLLRSHV